MTQYGPEIEDPVESGIVVPHSVNHNGVSVPPWYDYFHTIARAVSHRSKDPSTKVGCVIVGQDKRILTVGYNGFPQGVSDYLPGLPHTQGVRWERPTKYHYVEHAERNAIYSAARNGVSLVGSTLYLYASQPLGICADCARAIIQSGVRCVWGYKPDFDRENLGESMLHAYAMFLDANIDLMFYNSTVEIALSGTKQYIIDELRNRNVPFNLHSRF